MERDKFQKDFATLVTRAWTDKDFKQRFLADPRAVLKENGIEVPEGTNIKIVENRDKLTHFVLPLKPDWDCGGRSCGCGVDGLCTCYMYHIWQMWFGAGGKG